MLVLFQPHGACSSEYVSAAGVAPGPTTALSKNSQSCQTLPPASKQKQGSPMFPPSSLTFPVHQQQLHLLPQELLPATVQAPAGGLAGLLYPGATGGVPNLSSCAPTVVNSYLLHQALPQQPYVSPLPAIVSSHFDGSACALPSATAPEHGNLAGVHGVTPSLFPVVCVLGYPQNNVLWRPADLGQQSPSASSSGQEELQPDSRTTVKEKQCLLHAENGREQRAGPEDLCEREEKYQSEFASTLEHQQEERQQRERQHPPLWRIPVVRDPLAAAAEDFNPIPVAEATLVRHLWKHARAAVEDPTSTPPFRWNPPPTQPPPSYWSDVQQHSRRLTHQQHVQHSQGGGTGESDQQDYHQNMCLQSFSREGAEADSVEALVRDTSEDNSHCARRRRRSRIPGSRRSHKKGCEGPSESQHRSRIETAAPCHVGEGEAGQTASVLSTRVGRSQSPSYSCPRRDDFTAERLIDAPAYTTNYLGLLSDTGMHYTKRYELPTLSRFLQAKHPVFLRARTSADEPQQRGRPSSRDVLRARTPRTSAHRRRKGRQGDKEAESSVSSHASATGEISYMIPSVPHVANSAAILVQPQTHPQLEQDQFIVPAAPVPTVTMSWLPQPGPVVFGEQHYSRVTPAVAEVVMASTDKSRAAPTAAAATVGPISSAAVPVCVVPQTTTTTVSSGIQPSVRCTDSLHYSLAEGASLAAVLPDTSVNAPAAVRQQNLAQVGLHCTPAASTSIPLTHPYLQVPQTTVYEMAQPAALSSFDATRPAFACVGTGTSADAAVLGSAAAACGSPRQHRVDFSAPRVRISAEQPSGTETPGQSQDEARRQTDRRAVNERCEKHEIQPQHEKDQHNQGTSEHLGCTNVPTFPKPEQPEQGEQPPQQQQTSQPSSRGHPLLQPESSMQYSPQIYLVQQEPQGARESETTPHETDMHPTHFLPAAQSRLVTPPVEVAVLRATPVSRNVTQSPGRDTGATRAGNPLPVALQVAPDADGFTAVDRMTGTTVQHPVRSAVGGSTSPSVVGVSSGTEVGHPLTFLPPGGRPGPSAATSTGTRATAPLDTFNERRTTQLDPCSYSVTTLPKMCSSPCVAASSPAVAPTAPVLLHYQPLQPQISIPALVVSGKCVQ